MADDQQRAWVVRVFGIDLGIAPTAAQGAPSSLRDTMDKSATKLDPKVAFTQARLRYDTGRKKVGAEIEKLMAAMRAHFQSHADFANIDKAIEEFAAIRDMLDDRLLTELDHGYTATTPEAEQASRAAAASIVAEYQAFLISNARLLGGIDTNPFTPVAVESVLPPLLAELAGHLA